MDAVHPHGAAMVRKLESHAPLADDEKAAVLRCPWFSARSPPIRTSSARATGLSSALVVEGFACRYALTNEGRRQILSFHIPGDIPDLQSLHLTVMDHSLATWFPPSSPSSSTRICAPSSGAIPGSGTCSGARPSSTRPSSDSGWSVSGGVRPMARWRIFSMSCSCA